VADDGDEITGHVLFSRMQCAPAMLLAALGPLAVSPPHQRLGIGSALVRRGLATCRSMDAAGCLVLGAPTFYGRFGFAPARANLRSPYSGLDAFQGLEFRPGALSGRTSVAYPAAFG
jgi:putative acetyltransferase